MYRTGIGLHLRQVKGIKFTLRGHDACLYTFNYQIQPITLTVVLNSFFHIAPARRHMGGRNVDQAAITIDIECKQESNTGLL